jgi:hypothetical protein
MRRGVHGQHEPTRRDASYDYNLFIELQQRNILVKARTIIVCELWYGKRKGVKIVSSGLGQTRTATDLNFRVGLGAEDGCGVTAK